MIIRTNRTTPDAGTILRGFSAASIIDELSFVIGERRADIARIKRERREAPEIKAARIEFAERMLARTEVARDVVCAAFMRAECETCGGRGEIGGWFGQTAESGGYETEACPDCTPIAKAEDDAERERRESPQ